MKLLSIMTLFLSFAATSQDFEKCEYELNPSICVGKKLAKKIDDLGEIKNTGINLKPGIYRYFKGYDQVEIGFRKIEVKRNTSRKLEITYYGSNGGILTYFTCENHARICQSPNRHLLAITTDDSFFVDWADDTNGTYQLIK